MRAYVIRRLLLIVPTLLVVTILVFFSVRFIPGSVIDLMVTEMAEESAAGQQIDAEYIKHVLGLDVPVHIQYVGWLWGALRGDFGNSLWKGTSVRDMIFDRYPVSFELGLFSMIIGLLISLPVGVYSAIRQDTLLDYSGRTFAILSLSIPNFWIATMVVVYPSIWWNWTPPVEYIMFSENPMGNVLQFLLPAIIMGTSMSAGIMRMTRTMMLEVLRQDYIRTAWAKGLPERAVVLRHAIKNAFIPIITITGPMILLLIGGSVIMEQIFCLPGLGRLFLDALNSRDYPVISAMNTITATAVLVVILAVDLTYAYLDPRIVYK